MAFDGPLIGGRYRLGPRLGKGAQGEIHLARDEKATGAEDREVIVKRLVPRGTWKSFELFEREAKVLSQLRHPGVPRHIATLEEPPGTFNLVMQRAPGNNLRDLVARRRLSQLELRDILIRCLEILDYLHTRSPAVVHRDLKPSNIMRAPDGKIALVDFGGVLDAARERGGSTIVGTFGYMAPEQLHGQATAATDIYALGATIVALAGGVEPEDVPRKGLRMDLDRHLSSLDPGFRAALAAMTDPDPDRRPQRARDVVALLAKSKPPRPEPDAREAREARDARDDPSRTLARRDVGALAPRRLFTDVQEPLGTLLRLGVLSFGAGGWVGMAIIRLVLTVLVYTGATLAFPARKQVVGVGHELDDMLAEGQGGFTDIMKSAIARRGSRD
ncbi:MAG TPA: serine/threonine-protein kinase [Kofleriaceae bacterium]|jgi:serine/threonine protein kinase|nr:serine/threonine-protein kinase [Kofleriaceae bacterium]